MSLMLNNHASVGDPAIVYNSALAKKELGLAFISARETLNHCV